MNIIRQMSGTFISRADLPRRLFPETGTVLTARTSREKLVPGTRLTWIRKIKLASVRWQAGRQAGLSPTKESTRLRKRYTRPATTSIIPIKPRYASRTLGWVSRNGFYFQPRWKESPTDSGFREKIAVQSDLLSFCTRSFIFIYLLLNTLHSCVECASTSHFLHQLLCRVRLDIIPRSFYSNLKCLNLIFFFSFKYFATLK